jgi:hypothetical protein
MSQEATIRRGVRNARYAAIPNHVFEDTRLSMDARWLLGYLLSKPDNWTVVIGDITKKGNCGRDKARGMIAELVKHGYAEREQQREEGKFGSSVLVIFDEPRDGVVSEIASENRSVAFLPQTDLPATASPSPVPPSPVKPAHSNNSDLENTDNQDLRESRRELREEEENPKDLERGFKRFFLGWKTAVNDSEPDARREWVLLAPDERLKATELSEAYQAAALSTGRKYLCAAAKYLKEKRWLKLPELSLPERAAQAVPDAYTAYSRAGRGLLLAELLRPMRPLTLNRIEETIVEASPDKTELIWRDKREKQGWPNAVRLIETTMQHRRFSVPQRIVSLSQDFDKVKVGSPVWEAWKRLHHHRCWPWLPAPDGLPSMQFPRLTIDFETDDDLDQAVEWALRDFEAKLEEVRGDDAA